MSVQTIKLVPIAGLNKAGIIECMTKDVAFETAEPGWSEGEFVAPSVLREMGFKCAYISYGPALRYKLTYAL